MFSRFVVITILMGGFLQDPTPTPSPPTSPLELWRIGESKQYPWPVPEIPVIPTVSGSAFAAPTIEHSDGYSDASDLLSDQVGTMTAPLSDLDTASNLFLGEGGSLEDMESGGDFDTGLDPAGSGSTLDWYEAADVAGESIGESFKWARTAVDLLTQLGGMGSAGVFVIFNLILIALVILVKFIGFAIRIGGSLWDVLVDIVNAILEFIPL